MRSSWLYLATRSERAGAPVLIWPMLSATARSAMVASSVSPERWEVTAVQPARWQVSTASMVSVREPIWLSLTSRELAALLLDGLAHAVGVGHQQVIAHDLEPVAQFAHHQLPALPVILGQAVFDGDDRVLIHPVLPEGDHLFAGQFLAFGAQVVQAGVFFVEFRGSRVEGNGHILLARP